MNGYFEPTPKMLAAVELLECGLQMYFENAFFAALHLAGASGEVLGNYVNRHGGKSSFDEMRDLTIAIASINGHAATKASITSLIRYPMNRTKHLNEEGDDLLHFDPKVQARAALERAVTDHYALQIRFKGLLESSLMRKFNQVSRAESMKSHDEAD